MALSENESQHHNGKWHGCGPVGDTERVVVAVFEQTPLRQKRLDPVGFKNNDLKNANFSTARSKFTSKAIFFERVIASGEGTKGKALGLSEAEVKAIRSIRAAIPTNGGQKMTVKAFSVYDCVEKGDFTSHATIGYTPETHENLSQKQVGTLRIRMNADLANVFSEVASIDDHNWPSPVSIFFSRVSVIAQLAVA